MLPPTTLHTIGHSNQPVEPFLELLKKHGIQQVIDVRSTPFSRYTPWFNINHIQFHLGDIGIDYKHLGDQLGGRPIDNRHYDNSERARYDLMAQEESFRDGLEQVITISEKAPTALMCTEKDPLRCHRTLLVCHELTTHMERTEVPDVHHILPDGRSTTHGELMDQLMTSLKMGSQPRAAQVEKAVRLQAEKAAYRRKR